VRVFGYPYAFYSPETDLAFGVGGIMSFRAGADTALRPSKVLLSAYYTANRQYKVTASHDLFAHGNRTAATVDLSFGKFIDKFYGIGPATPDTGSPAYLLELLSLEGSYSRRIGESTLRAGAIVRADRQNNVDVQDNGFLRSDSVPGSQGGWVSGIGSNLVWDSRDNIFFPTRGTYSDVRVTFYLTTFGGEFDFTEAVADLRWYVPVGRHVLGIQAYTALVRGEPPYFKLPKLGGGVRMRGYYEGRYRDRTYTMAQAEYRTTLFWRLGFVAFAGVGDVADSYSKYRLRDVKTSLGFGLRFLFDPKERINIRADFGFGRNTSGVYFAIEEAF
jgi:outer membrane protein assembly factor BamA